MVPNVRPTSSALFRLLCDMVVVRITEAKTKGATGVKTATQGGYQSNPGKTEVAFSAAFLVAFIS